MRFLGGGGPWAIHPVSALAEMGCSTDCGVAEPCPILATAGLSSILTLSISPSPLCPALTCQTLLLLFLPYNSYLAASLGTALTSRYVDAARRIDVLHQPCRTHSNTGPLPALSQHMLHRPLIKPPAASTALIPSHHPPPALASRLVTVSGLQLARFLVLRMLWTPAWWTHLPPVLGLLAYARKAPPETQLRTARLAAVPLLLCVLSLWEGGGCEGWEMSYGAE